jgi:hypothetical protein
MEATTMTSESLRHDAAWATSIQIVEIFAPLLRDEEKRDAFEEVFARVKDGLDAFEIKQQRLQQRMKPEGN